MLLTPQRWGDEAFCCGRAEFESLCDRHEECCRRELAPWPRSEGRLALGTQEWAESGHGHLEDMERPVQRSPVEPRVTSMGTGCVDPEKAEEWPERKTPGAQGWAEVLKAKRFGPGVSRWEWSARPSAAEGIRKMTSPVGWGGPGDHGGTSPAEGDMEAMRQVSGRGPSSRHSAAHPPAQPPLPAAGGGSAPLSLAHP